MKPWIAALVIIPAGLLLGLAGAGLVEADTMREGQFAEERPPIAAAPAERRGWGTLEPDRRAQQRFAQGSGRFGPGLDEDYWPEDHLGVYAGPYAPDESYFGRGASPELDLDDPNFLGGVPGRSGADEAQAASLAAERAARDAEVAAAAGAEEASGASAGTAPPNPRPDPPGPRLPEPGPALPEEPRTADGDLPAIW